jgi:hypothetical protein
MRVRRLTEDSIHNLGMVGHIEDIAVAKDQQGKKLGLRIIQALDYVAEKVGCYKVCTSLLHSLVCPARLTVPSRQYSIAPKRTKDSTLSVDIEEQAWKWRTTMRHPRTVMSDIWNVETYGIRYGLGRSRGLEHWIRSYTALPHRSASGYCPRGSVCMQACLKIEIHYTGQNESFHYHFPVIA